MRAPDMFQPFNQIFNLKTGKRISYGYEIKEEEPQTEPELIPIHSDQLSLFDL